METCQRKREEQSAVRPRVLLGGNTGRVPRRPSKNAGPKSADCERLGQRVGCGGKPVHDPFQGYPQAMDSFEDILKMGLRWMDLGSKGSGLGSNENKREDELKAREEGCRGDRYKNKRVGETAPHTVFLSP